MWDRSKPLSDLTAGDLMSREVVRLPEDTPLRDAARLLLQHRIGGAPVVDREGRCVGVFSSVDVLRLAERRADPTRPAAPPPPTTCSFQAQHRTRDGSEVTLCTLPPGVCPIQRTRKGPEGEMIECSQPHCVLADWQMVELEALPADAVRHFMTPDPVTARPDAPARARARMMVDAHIHRVVVVDEKRVPVGVVSSTDLLAALAYCGGREQTARP
jgi:CBS domain-containing protein